MATKSRMAFLRSTIVENQSDLYFKQRGIFGWTDLGMSAEATGRIIQSAESTDGFYTIDLEIPRKGLMTVTHNDITAGPKRFPSYIRIEVPPEVRGNLPKPNVGEWFHVKGDLKWDGDGFLEVHSEKPGDARKVPARP